MAGIVVDSTARVLREHGPDILRQQYWETHVIKPDVPKWMDRLHAAAGPHKSGADPHIAGRALDIVLFANIPNEMHTADRIVSAFLNLREQMKWISVVYNGWEWNRFGGKMVRGGSETNRHVTHIHIEWGEADMSLTGFEDALAAEMTNIPDVYE